MHGDLDRHIASCARAWLAIDMPPRTVTPKTDPASSRAGVNGAEDATLRVLRVTDDAIESIVAQSKHCVLYGFDGNTRQWTKRSVEGALFVVRRSSAPRDAFVVLNRAGSENFTREIGGENFELERNAPYLMYRVGREVNGIWFHDQDECEMMCAAFERVMANAKASAAAAAAANGASDSLRALFASASLNESASASANSAAGSGSNGVIRVLQAPRKVVGTVAEAPRTRSTSIKSSVAPPPPPSAPVVTPTAVRAALLELIKDDDFIDRLSRAIAKHS